MSGIDQADTFKQIPNFEQVRPTYEASNNLPDNNIALQLIGSMAFAAASMPFLAFDGVARRLQPRAVKFIEGLTPDTEAKSDFDLGRPSLKEALKIRSRAIQQQQDEASGLGLFSHISEEELNAADKPSPSLNDKAAATTASQNVFKKISEIRQTKKLEKAGFANFLEETGSSPTPSVILAAGGLVYIIATTIKDSASQQLKKFRKVGTDTTSKPYYQLPEGTIHISLSQLIKQSFRKD
jgi:DNA-binding transcriptional regulator YiaG